MMLWVHPRGIATAAPVLGAIVAVGCHGLDGDDDTAGGGEAFAFAIITDTHIGEGEFDHGGPGFADPGSAPPVIGEGTPAINTRAAVAVINDAVDELDIRFVVHLGDATDSGESSELERAAEILDDLVVPYVPLIGNHDMWPYAWTSDETYSEASGPTGDAAFVDVFSPRYETLASELPEWTLAPMPVDDPGQDVDSHLINLAFDYGDIRFVGLDLGTRDHAPEGYPGVGPEAELHDIDGGSWSFLVEQLQAHGEAGDDHLVLMSHHPPLALGVDSLSGDEFEQLEALLQPYGGTVSAWFAGHWHVDLSSDIYGDFDVVLTGAAKETSRVRVVQVDESGAVDVETLLGESR